MIYHALYWNKMNGDEIANQNIATCIFDTGVNRGMSVGNKYAQRVCNQLGSSLVLDGQLGPKSIAAINGYAQHAFVTHYEALEWAGYEALLSGNPGKYGIYRHGWEARARKLLTLA